VRNIGEGGSVGKTVARKGVDLETLGVSNPSQDTLRGCKFYIEKSRRFPNQKGQRSSFIHFHYVGTSWYFVESARRTKEVGRTRSQKGQSFQKRGGERQKMKIALWR